MNLLLIITNKHKTKSQHHILSNIHQQKTLHLEKRTKLWSELYFVFSRLDAIYATLCPSSMLRRAMKREECYNEGGSARERGYSGTTLQNHCIERETSHACILNEPCVHFKRAMHALERMREEGGGS